MLILSVKILKDSIEKLVLTECRVREGGERERKDVSQLIRSARFTSYEYYFLNVTPCNLADLQSIVSCLSNYTSFQVKS
jgi:ABC-type lipopolysaccharide export system ATPase subunit